MNIIKSRSANRPKVKASYTTDGQQIPEANPTDLYENQSGEDLEAVEESRQKARSIVNDLTSNNQFAVAREVAIRTYDSAWFAKEYDVSFKLAMATELHTTFNADGYTNAVWKTISGKN